MTAAPDIAGYIDRYVAGLKSAGAIGSPAIEAAFRQVPRHRLLETFTYRDETGPVRIDHDPQQPRARDLELIYADHALATRHIDGWPASSTSMPSMMAEALARLDLSPGMRVLEVGAGTGYNAALMAEITGDQHLVTAVDNLPDVVEQTSRLLAAAGYPGIGVRHGDGFDGAGDQAPFDRIVASVGCSDLSPHWAAQLAGGGAMLIPLAHCGSHPFVLLRREAGELRGRLVLWTGFMPARGPLFIKDQWPAGMVHGAREEIGHEPAPGPGAVLSGPGEEDGFLFFLGLHDRRALHLAEGPGLSAMHDGWAMLGPDGITWWKDVTLARTLERRYLDWDARGRPGAGDYEISFSPAGQDGVAPPGGWVIGRRFYRELVTLTA
jgi:protein-L-isoaspartate(D-aspartate) O-methyltransferase